MSSEENELAQAEQIEKQTNAVTWPALFLLFCKAFAPR